VDQGKLNFVYSKRSDLNEFKFDNANAHDSQPDGASSIVAPLYVDRHKYWKLAQPIDDAGAQEEVVLRLQGIICQKSLPPIQDRLSRRV
jgi:hypothetical protein